MGDYLFREPDGGASSSEEERPVPSPSTTLVLSNPNPLSIGPGLWVRAEKATQNILCKVQATAVSEHTRKEVIDFVQRLFRNSLRCEVLPYGSVPLKTYLPDGDIDLTAFGGASAENVLANGMISVLEAVDQSRAAEFAVKDVQLIRAEVKLVKCIVQNIVVDISFNQIGGLCTLCFLEQVDRLIGKEHLFKRSIILIKAWCYYESRILGAPHGLISTYALEMLVLYIFHLFHSTLNGPLAVLYKFLDYFSKFDWENYCVSLTGPVRLSSLPDLVAEKPDNGGSDLLLNNEFLKYCTDRFSVPSRGADLSSRAFQPKHLNIVDPLKENNNLGRSVSKGNFYRIRSAFTYGARKLGRILMQTEDDIADGLCNFFFNTLDRHGSGQTPDVQGPRSIYGLSGSSPASSISDTDSYAVEKVILESSSNANFSSDYRINGLNASESESKYSRENEEEVETMEVRLSKLSFEGEHHEVKNVLDHRFFGEGKELATYRVEGLNMPDDLPKYSELSGLRCMSSAGTLHHAPHLCFSNSIMSNGGKTTGNPDFTELQQFQKDAYPGVSSGFNGSINGCVLEENMTVGEDGNPVPGRINDVHPTTKVVSKPENSHHITRDWTLPSARYLDYSDLSGDIENHLNRLQYARWCHEYAYNMPALPVHQPSFPLFHGKNPWEDLQPLTHIKKNGFSHKMVNGVVPNPAPFAVNHLMIPPKPFGLEEMPKPRGTGTYFPNVNPLTQGHRPSSVKGRNHGLPRSPRHGGRMQMFVETNTVDQRSSDFSPAPVSMDQSGGSPGPSNVNHSYSRREKGHPEVNGVALQPEGGFELVSMEKMPIKTNQVGRGRHGRQRNIISPEKSTPDSPKRAGQMLNPVTSRDHDSRVSVEESYHLKDEEDFPSLSV